MDEQQARTHAVPSAMQPLADALAVAFAQSLTSRRTCAALCRLLPGLECLSIGVRSGHNIVASANHAVEGPTVLQLHDARHSAASQALGCGRMLQASLQCSVAAAKMAAAWSDVRQMAADSPAATHLLCIPFGGSGCSSGGGGAAYAAHPVSGGARGALLLGFSQHPALDDRRRHLLAELVRCLPASLGCLAPAALEFVSFSCGVLMQCDCICCPPGSDGLASGAATRCNSAAPSHGGGGGGGGSASPVLGATAPAQTGEAGADAAGPSNPPPAAANPAAAGTAAGLRLPGPSGGPPPPATPQASFSKALLAAAAAGGAVHCQCPLLLRFRLPLMEQEFVRWMAPLNSKMDRIAGLLMLLGTLAIASSEALHVAAALPHMLLLGAGMLLPLAYSHLPQQRYTAWRDVFTAAFRLYAVGFACLAGTPFHQSQLPPGRLHSWVAFWRLTGAEALFASALGFHLRQALHVPIQLALLAAALAAAPRTCARAYPKASAVTCFIHSAAMLTSYGFLFPTAVLRYVEQRSRRTFTRLLRAAAAGA